MSVDTEWLIVGELPDVINCVRRSSDDVWCRYVPERMCKVVSKPCDMWECECGMAWWHAGTPNYCPKCGAKVVEK